MTNYVAIPKKYRPKKFCDVACQEPIVQTLKNALKFNRIGPAYLFCGTRGTGKTTLARLFAKAINCPNRNEESEPCNTCTSCVEINLGSSLDIIEIDGASNRGIDDIRNINETVGYSSSSSLYKIYIIDEVHMLTKEAFNALLKTLEEPPSHVVFFFATTEPHKVLPTILSRCQRFNLRRITRDKIEDKLLTITNELEVAVEKEVFQALSLYADGSLRDAESLLEQLLCYEDKTISKQHVSKILGFIDKELFLELDEAVSCNNLSAAFVLSHKALDSGAQIQFVIESLSEHFSNIANRLLGTYSKDPFYEKALSVYSINQVIEILDYLVEMLERCQKSPFKQMHLEVIFLRIIRSKQKISLESLVDRLEKLQSSAKDQNVEFLEKTSAKQDISANVNTPSASEISLSKKGPSVQEKQPPQINQTAQKIDSSNLNHSSPIIDLKEQIRHEQILRFASVELNGHLNK